ncbi:MAG: hypothetical protein ACRDVO_15680 [Jiangellaceae bacterium]
MQELRSRIRSSATEYKANHLLRDKHRSILEWLLRPAGPLHRNARVYLVEKAFFIVSSVIGLLVEQVTHPARMGLFQGHRARAMTVTLYREGRRAFGPERWQAFRASSNDLLRVTDRVDEKASVDSSFRIVGGPRTFGTFDRVDEVVRLLRQGRPHVEAYRAQVRVDPTMTPVLDPLIPAILRAVAYWGQGRTPVSIVHDRQNTLSETAYRPAEGDGRHATPCARQCGASSPGRPGSRGIELGSTGSARRHPRWSSTEDRIGSARR